MTIIKLIRPLYQNRSQFLRCNQLLFQQIARSKRHTAVTKANEPTEVDTNVRPLSEKVKETTKTASYLGIILLGVGVTGSLFYAVFQELFSSKSPNSIYSRAVERCKEDTRVQDKLGLPITAFGNETRRRRRQHVSHLSYEKDGKQYMRMRFFLKGSFHQGTVNLEMVQGDSGKYEYRYLFVEVEDMLNTTIILEDNRGRLNAVAPSGLDALNQQYL